MKVNLKDIAVDMEIKNRGIHITVADNDDDHQGNFYVTKSKLIWCEGKTRRENGKEISWDDFREFMNNR